MSERDTLIWVDGRGQAHARPVTPPPPMDYRSAVAATETWLERMRLELEASVTYYTRTIRRDGWLVKQVSRDMIDWADTSMELESHPPSGAGGGR